VQQHSPFWDIYSILNCLQLSKRSHHINTGAKLDSIFGCTITGGATYVSPNSCVVEINVAITYLQYKEEGWLISVSTQIELCVVGGGFSGEGIYCMGSQKYRFHDGSASGFL